MARTAGKKQAPAKIEEDDDAEGWEDAVVDADDKEAAANLRLRDWRDVERFREMRELRRLVDDDYGLEEIFHLPVKLKPRAEPGIPVPPTIAKMLKPLPGPAARPAAKAAPAKPVAVAKPANNSKTHAKPAPANHAKAHAKPAAANHSKAHPKPAAAKHAPASARSRTELKAKAKRR